MASGDDGVGAKAITGAQFEQSLTQAERLLDACDTSRARVRLCRIWIFLVVLAVALVLIITVGNLSAVAGFAVAAVLAAIAVGLASTFMAHVRALQDTLRRDERAMLEVIDVLRELLPDIAKEESWGPARYQIATARVSRFPIGRRGSR